MHIIEQEQVVALGIYKTTQTGVSKENFGARGIRVATDIQLNAGSSGSITVNIYEHDANNNKRLLLASAALTAVAKTYLTVYPTITASNNVIAQDAVGRFFSIDVVANNANPVTYQVGYTMLA